MRSSLCLAVCVSLGAGPALLACSSDSVHFWASPEESGGAANVGTSSGGTPSGTTGSGGTDKESTGGVAGQDGSDGSGGSSVAGTSALGGSSGGTDPLGGSGGTGGSGGSDASGGSGGASGGTAGTDSGGSGGSTTVDPVVLHADFQERAASTYTQGMVEGDFGAAPEWNDGLDEQRAKVVVTGEDHFLRVTFEGGEYGPSDGGVQFKVPLKDSYEELYLSYRVRFSMGFQFVKGGKLPGLVGGTAPTGCITDDDGFSARGMWRTMGRAVQYVYYAEKEAACGDDFDYESDGSPFSFERGIWHTIEHHLVMNTPGEGDGVLEAWVDGEPVLAVDDIVYRAANASFRIDTLYFSTFFGGSDMTWAPSTNQTLDYDDFIVSTAPITH
jgi:hypothetical protein